MTPPTPLVAPAAPRVYRPGPGLLNVGDLVAELPDGRLVSAAAWDGPRAAFAAAFGGVSDSHHDPDRPARTGPFPPPVVARPGGTWRVAVRGTPAPGDPLGPAAGPDGKLDPWALEPVADPAEAVAVAGREPGTAVLFARPGEVPAATD